MTPPEDPTEPTRNDTSNEQGIPDRSTESREIPVDHDELAELARRRGLYFPAAEVHDGVAGFYTYGPTGAAIKRNVEAAWRDRFVVVENNHEIETPTIVPKSVFAASGHLDSFDDLLIACQTCDHRHRADHLVEHHTDIADAEHLSPVQIEDLIATHGLSCPDCGASLADCPVGEFQLMFETGIGPDEDQSGYLQPETAQSTLIEFSRLAEYAHEETPFGVAQIGRGYRNEISPRQAIVRLRELTMAELQSFHLPNDDTPIHRTADVDLRLYPAERQTEATDPAETEYIETTVEKAVAEDVVPSAWTAYYLGVAREWLASVGVTPANLRFRQHRDTELAHYAEDCWDAEAEVDDDWIELAGIADRADNDLVNHAEATGASFTLFREYDEPQTVERVRIVPDMSVLGPRFGDRVSAVVERLEALARTDLAAFEKQEVTIEVPMSASGDTKDPGATEQISLSTDHIDVSVETVTEHGEQVRPHVIEPAFGVDRVVYTILAHSLRSDVVDGEPRRYLALDPAVAPTLAATLPLTDGVAERARELAEACRQAGLSVEHDNSGSIGRRYRRQDEIGTPYCVTLDERTISDNTATIRHRDTTEQVRVSVEEIPMLLRKLRNGRRTFEDLQNET